MAEKIYGVPFDANEIILPNGTPGYDNVLYAQDLADWLKTYFKNGVLVPGGALISTELQVTKVDDTAVRLDSGDIVINGRTGFNKAPINFVVDKAIPNKERWDRAIVELNLSTTVNSFRSLIIQGILSETPSAPDLVRNDEIYQMSLATIKVSETGVYEIVDDRANEDLCGISQVLIGVRNPLPVTGDEASNIGYDPSYSGLKGTTVQLALDEVAIEVKAIKDSAGNVKELRRVDVTVTSSDWVITTEYESARYRADISFPGSTQDMDGEVIFSPDDADSGIFSGACLVNNNSLTILAKERPAQDIVIPVIKATKAV